MDLIFWIIVAGAAILNIWLICLFVSLTTNVKSILARLEGFDEGFSRKDLKLAIIQGRQDKAYQAITKRLYNILCELVENTSESPNYIEKTAASRIELAEKMCREIGRELPAQLQSFETFKQYINS